MRRFASLVCVLALAGCGGGGSQGAAQGPTPPQGPALAQTAPATFAFVMSKKSSASKRSPAYLTTAAQSIALQVTGLKKAGTNVDLTSTLSPAMTAPQTVDVNNTSGNPNLAGQCGTDPANAQNVRCTEIFQLPVGDTSVRIEAFDGVRGTGNRLAAQGLTLTVQSGSNTFAVTLDAVAQSIVVTSSCPGLVGTSSFTVYVPTDVTANVAVYDVHGVRIDLTVPGAPVLSASSSDASVLTASASGSTVTIHPVGTSGHALVTVKASPPSSGDGITAATTSFVVTLAVPTGTLYVSSRDLINVYPASASGAVTPQRQITGFYRHSDGNPPPCGIGCYTISLGDIAAAANGTLLALHVFAQHNSQPNNAIEVYGPTASGPATPQASYDARGWGYGIATTPGSAGFDIINGSNVIEYSNGQLAGQFTTAYPALSGLSVDTSGQVFVSVPNLNLIAVYAPNASGSPSPIRTFATGPNPHWLAFGPDGTLYVIVFDGVTLLSSVQEFAPGAASPVRTLGPFVKNGQPQNLIGIALDAVNELYVSFDDSTPPRTNSISVFAPGATDPSAPVRTIQNPISPTSLSPGGGTLNGIAIGP